MKKISVFLSSALLLCAACTKDNEGPKASDGKPMVSRKADPERVVFETELDLPKEFKASVKKTDLMIWDVKTTDGNVVSAQISPVPTFPAKLTVTARQLFTPVAEGSHLLFSARIVHFGDEGKPPKKGQLQVFVGEEPSDHEAVENKAMAKASNQKLLDKFMKKVSMTLPVEDVSIGTKTKAQFAPSLL